MRPEWLASRREAPLEPERELVDAHHHLWDRPATSGRYLLPDLLADTNQGHNIVSTVFVQCRAMHRAGGPEAYTGRTMEVSHRRLGVTDEAFDKVVGHLGATLDDLGVDPEVRDQVAAVLVAQREHIVTVPATV